VSEFRAKSHQTQNRTHPHGSPTILFLIRIVCVQRGNYNFPIFYPNPSVVHIGSWYLYNTLNNYPYLLTKYNTYFCYAENPVQKNWRNRLIPYSHLPLSSTSLWHICSSVPSGHSAVPLHRDSAGKQALVTTQSVSPDWQVVVRTAYALVVKKYTYKCE